MEMAGAGDDPQEDGGGVVEGGGGHHPGEVGERPPRHEQRHLRLPGAGQQQQRRLGAQARGERVGRRRRAGAALRRWLRNFNERANEHAAAGGRSK